MMSVLRSLKLNHAPAFQKTKKPFREDGNLDVCVCVCVCCMKLAVIAISEGYNSPIILNEK